jgi:hypothetical protein
MQGGGSELEALAAACLRAHRPFPRLLYVMSPTLLVQMAVSAREWPPVGPGGRASSPPLSSIVSTMAYRAVLQQPFIGVCHDGVADTPPVRQHVMI